MAETKPKYQLTQLGTVTRGPSKKLETFPLSESGALSAVRFTSNELMSNCPVTQQPDFNSIVIEYQPISKCLESKSLKLYLASFKDEYIFGEELAILIAKELYGAVEPEWLHVTLIQNIRGGLQMTVEASL